MATSDLIGGGNIEPRGLEEEMRSSYLDYAMSVIVGRALPDVRDGLKPVHRRVLFAMNEAGLQPNRGYAKSARIVGDVMGKYHPHGDSAIYDTLVRLAQDFSMREPLVDGQGNFGSVDDDPAAAMRYTEARLAPLAREMLRDLDADTVDFQPNYDGQNREPVVLPARFPNLLVNGASGIAVGMEGLMKHLRGPDFPTGGVILGTAGIREAYETGRGRIRVRARAHTEPLSHGKEAIIVTELPFMVKKGGDGGVIKKIAELVHEKKITEISDLRDETDRNGMRIVIELKRDAIPKVVVNKLYKHTPMQATFGVNTVALVDNVQQTPPLKNVIRNYVQHQREVIVRRSKHELRSLEARVHRLEGLLIALDHLDEVIELIRSSRDRDAARAGLIERFGLTHVQAQAILELRLQQLTALEADAIRREHADLVERIRELRELLGDEDKVYGLIKEELQEIAERYGDERRTKITHAEDDVDIEDLIADQQMVIAITHSGYIKSLPLATYRMQRRGGVGVTGMDMKDDDYIEHLFVCSTHEYLLFFTNRGKVYRSKVYELPEAGRTSKGRYLGNVLPLREGERVQSVLATRDFSESDHLVFATRRGTVKKTEFQAYNTPIKADGIIAINIRDEDELISVRRVDAGDEVLMVSSAGLAVRFSEEDARAMCRDTTGVRGMDVPDDVDVIAMDVARDDQYLLVVTDNGCGKRGQVGEYRKTNRGAKGVKTIQQTEAKGRLAGALVVREHHQLVFISQNGMVQRIAVRDFRPLGRNAQGFRLMNVREDDRVSAIALVMEEEAATPDSAETVDPESITAGATDADEIARAGPADPTDPATITPPEVSEDDVEP